METSGTITPYVMRREPPPGASRAVRLSQTMLTGGGGLALAALVTTAAVDLTRGGQLVVVLLAVTGTLTASLGQRRAIRLRGALRRLPLLVLDEDGAAIRTGALTGPDQWSRADWSDLARVVARRREIGPPLLAQPIDATVLHFVARDDAQIRVDAVALYDAAKAAVLGLTPAASTLTLIVQDHRAAVVREVQDWLAAHRPDVAFEA